MAEWDLKKKQAFVAAMGKKRQGFAKGGVVRRKRFADGGTALAGPTNSPNGIANQTVGVGLAPAIAQYFGLNNNYLPSVAANIQSGTNVGQLNAGYTGAQDAITRQKMLADQFAPGAQQGIQTEADLTNQLQGVVSGRGPNPAQAALARNTGRNIAATTAAMAGQRGAAGNVGLIAREAAQQGAGTEQQAVGDAATLQAQQAIAAQEQLQNLATTQVGQATGAVQGLNSAQQNEQNILQGANTALNNANVTMQSNINSVDAQTASGNQAAAGSTASGVGSAIGTGLMAAALLAKGGEVPHMADGGPLIPHPLHGPGTPGPGNGIGPWLNSSPNTGGGPTITPPGQLAKMPEISFKPNKDIAEAIGSLGGSPSQLDLSGMEAPSMTSGDNFSSSAVDGGLSGGEEIFAARGGRICPGPHRSHVANFLASGGVTEKVPAMLSPGEVYLSPEKVRKVVEDGANPMTIGERIGGKAKRANDSFKNDTVPMTLREGGVVIPRHITTHKMAAEKAELFVHRALARKKAKSH